MPAFRLITRECAQCGATFDQHSGGRGDSRCLPCGVAWSHYKLHGSGRYAANLKLKSAIRKGLIKSPAESVCVDCGRPAQCHDHRDYSKPLDVSPVCFSCNVRRGPAKPVAEFQA